MTHDFIKKVKLNLTEKEYYLIKEFANFIEEYTKTMCNDYPSDYDVMECFRQFTRETVIKDLKNIDIELIIEKEEE